MAKPIIVAAGIDTSKAKLDIAIQDGAAFEVANDKVGWQQAARRLAKAGVSRVGIEATGGYQRGVTRFLEAAGFVVLVLQPLQVRAFAQLRLQRAKNDKIDAKLIAACTLMLDTDKNLPPDARFDALADHLTAIEQWEEDIARVKTRLEFEHTPRRKRILLADIKRFQKRRAAEMLLLREALCRHEDLGQRLALVESIPGIGLRTGLSIVIRMPELGQVSREQIAALAGLAPFVHQSGKRKGETHIGGGRDRVRKSLYMASFTGVYNWNPQLKAVYQRLRERGKTHKQAIIACARKLLIFANTVVARHSPWEAKTNA